jgi:predicted nucleic acid-binding protein
MTCSSSLSETLTPIVPDTSVLINLHACSFGEQVLRSIPNEIVVPDVVVTELDHETSRANGENDFVQNFISQGIIQVASLDDGAYRIFETLIASPGSLDDGEAATIAVAATQGLVPVIDERRGRARAEAVMNGKFPAWSLDLLVHPAVQAGLPGGAYIDAVYMALSEGRMRIDEERCDAVVALIGIERAGRCTSLPGFRLRRQIWAGQADGVTQTNE